MNLDLEMVSIRYLGILVIELINYSILRRQGFFGSSFQNLIFFYSVFV